MGELGLCCQLICSGAEEISKAGQARATVLLMVKGRAWQERLRELYYLDLGIEPDGIMPRKLPSSVCMGIYMTPKEKSGVFLGSMEPLDQKQIDHIASCLPNIIVPQITNIACLYTIDFAGNLSVRAPPSVGTSSAHATPELNTASPGSFACFLCLAQEGEGQD
ncbi:uncharacterized protein [Triticum aestivum]|uniref:uncharacterized protein n=1 Tax=Triticum aestivum TaxID=4565 RepID=UPI001D031E03|nr:uncharacterized protein LOC123073905 [Triticum aestivum]XP_044352840.1 uncharacterized protein LOC123073905 [Triticum aestivum]